MINAQVKKMNEIPNKNNSIEYLESTIYKQCKQLREYIFMNDCYDLALVSEIAKNIKDSVESLIIECDN
jgi:hypothetical protein